MKFMTFLRNYLPHQLLLIHFLLLSCDKLPQNIPEAPIPPTIEGNLFIHSASILDDVVQWADRCSIKVTGSARGDVLAQEDSSLTLINYRLGQRWVKADSFRAASDWSRVISISNNSSSIFDGTDIVIKAETTILGEKIIESQDFSFKIQRPLLAPPKKSDSGVEWNRPKAIVSAPEHNVVLVSSVNDKGIFSVDITQTPASVYLVNLPDLGEPEAIAVLRHSNIALVGESGLNPSVRVIDFQDYKEVLSPIELSSEPFRIAVSPDGTIAYITSPAASRVFRVELDSLRAKNGAKTKDPQSISVDGRPHDVAVGYFSKAAYVTNTSLPGLHIISPETGSPQGMIDLSFSARNIEVSNDERFALVSSAQAPGRIELIDLIKREKMKLLELGGDSLDIAITPHGQYALITNTAALTMDRTPASGHIMILQIKSDLSDIVPIRSIELSLSSVPLAVTIESSVNKAFFLNKISRNAEIAALRLDLALKHPLQED